MCFLLIQIYDYAYFFTVDICEKKSTVHQNIVQSQKCQSIYPSDAFL